MIEEVKYSFLFWFWKSSSARATAITCSWRIQTVKAPATFLQRWPDKSINSRGHEINCRGNKRLDRICSYISPRITLCLFLLSNPLCTCSIGRGKAVRAKHLLESIAHISNIHLESQCHRVNHCHCYELVTVFIRKRHPLKRLGVNLSVLHAAN